MAHFSHLLFIILTFVFGYLWWRERRNSEILGETRQQLVQERQRVLSFLNDIGEAFTENLQPEEILKMIIHCCVRTAEAKSGAIFLLDAEKQSLEAAVTEGPFPPPHPVENFMESKVASRTVFLDQIVKSQSIPLGQGILGGVAQNGKPVLIRHPAEDTRLPHYENEILRIQTFMAVPLIFRDQILGVLALANTRTDQPFGEMDLSLVTALSDQAAFAIYNAKLYHMLAEKERMDRDLQIAREIQQILLPKTFPPIEGFQVAATNVPALEVGGDYFDLIPVSPTHWGIAIADVSGKGVSGALVMAMCRSALRATATGNPSPGQVLREVNRLMHRDMREDLFISMIYGVLDVSKREFTFCRAGHEPFLLQKAGKENVEILSACGMALGIDNGTVFDSLVEEKKVTLQAGDVMVFYTDGVTEALDEAGQEFGMNQLTEAVHTCANQSATEIAGNLEERVRRFVGQHPQNDDITMIVVRA